MSASSASPALCSSQDLFNHYSQCTLAVHLLMHALKTENGICHYFYRFSCSLSILYDFFSFFLCHFISLLYQLLFCQSLSYSSCSYCYSSSTSYYPLPTISSPSLYTSKAIPFLLINFVIFLHFFPAPLLLLFLLDFIVFCCCVKQTHSVIFLWVVINVLLLFHVQFKEGNERRETRI